MIERDMEDLIASYLEDFFGRKQLVLVGRQQSFAGVETSWKISFDAAKPLWNTSFSSIFLWGTEDLGEPFPNCSGRIHLQSLISGSERYRGSVLRHTRGIRLGIDLAVV